MKNKKTQNYEIQENLKEIDFLDEYFPITQKCRESYFQLSHLLDHLKKEVPYNLVDESENNYIAEGQRLFDKYKKIDKGCRKSSYVNIAPAEFYEVNIKDLYDNIKMFLELNSQMDKLQIDILSFLVNHQIAKSKTLASRESLLEELYDECNAKYLVDMVFFHSSDESKIDNYKLYSNDNNVIKDLKEQGIELPAKFKLQDNSYLVKKRQLEYRYWHKVHLDILKTMSTIAQEKQQRKLTKIVAFLTIVSTITSIINLAPIVIQWVNS